MLHISRSLFRAELLKKLDEGYNCRFVIVRLETEKCENTLSALPEKKYENTLSGLSEKM